MNIQPIAPESVTYFHGKITREQSEELLLNRGGTEGLYLLRESVNGNFAVSLCYNQRVHHYSVERQSDGSYQIPTGRRFIGPVELVKHHSQHLDGFLTLARFPLERYPPGHTYYVLQGVTALDLEERLRLKAIQLGLKGSNSIEEALSGPMRDHLKQLVLKDLHHSQPWYHENIHRNDAENRLAEAGHTEGQYLVRHRKDDNSYVLSISFQGEPKHYKINCAMEKYQIDGGQHFNSLVEMIDHYHFRQDGLLCKLRFAIESSKNQRGRSGGNSTTSQSVSGASTPSSLPLSSTHAEKCLTPPQTRLHHNHPQQHHLQSSLGARNNSLPHTTDISASSTCNPLPTFSSESSSSSSSNAIDANTNVPPTPADLINFSEASQQQPINLLSPLNIIATNNLFMNSSSHNPAQIAHSNSSSNFQPFNQQKIVFHSPSHIITPLQITQNKLEEACNNFSSGFTPTPTPANINHLRFSSIDSTPVENNSSHINPLSSALNPNNINSSFVNCTNQKKSSLPSSHHSMDSLDKSFGGLNHSSIMDNAWEEPDLEPSSSRQDITNLNIQQRLNRPQNSPNSTFIKDLFSEATQVIYDSLPVDDDTFNLEPNQINIKEKLGGGNFGHVFGGVYNPPHEKSEVPVAIKMLKQDQISSVNEDEILIEARLMAQLKHRHIVRLIGVCRDQQVMLVLELAPLGPINKYLRKNKDMSILNVTELMYQVALGMAYLEASKFVHRDLAARNVLLVTEKYAKISDFGMSKALKFGNDYYRAANAGKWPIKWYAPECIYYFKFDSKSDVWSYGVTMWECYSYGERPYKDMKGTQILQMIDSNKRLPKPPDCPEQLHGVMRQCWEFEGVRRPTFAELVLTLSRILNNFHTGLVNVSNTQSAPVSRYGSGEASF